MATLGSRAQLKNGYCPFETRLEGCCGREKETVSHFALCRLYLKSARKVLKL